MKKLISLMLALNLCLGLAPMGISKASANVNPLEEYSADTDIKAKDDIALDRYISVSVPETNVASPNAKSITVQSGTWGSLNWTLDDEGLFTISGNGAMDDFSFFSRDAWLAYKADIKSVAIESGVTSIGEWAFEDCSNLVSITLPDSVTSIGDRAFYGCSSLVSITIPDSVTNIGYYAFYKCSSLESMTIPDSVTNIGEGAFNGCSSLVSITIPGSVTSIGAGAFYNCSELTNISVNEGNTSYCSIDGVLFNNDKTTLIQFPAAKGGTYSIPEGVTGIGERAFTSCSSLVSITLPDSVTSIGDAAFRYCSSLVSITLPDSVTSIGYDAFYDTTLYNNKANWKDGVLYIGKHLIRAKGDISTSYTIKEGTLTIAESAFSYCYDLVSITIPDSVTSIGEYAFYDCSSLESITIPDSVTSIGEYAFSGCNSLASITIPGSVTSIEHAAFYKCSSLSAVYYGGSEEDWQNIDIAIGNDALRNANKIYVATTRGDVNDDGKIDATDYILIKRQMLNIGSLEGDALKAADANADGKIDATDYITVKRKILFG